MRKDLWRDHLQRFLAAGVQCNQQLNKGLDFRTNLAYDHAGKFAGEIEGSVARSAIRFFPGFGDPETAISAGFRTGGKGTHSSRTLMFDDLRAVLHTASTDSKAAYVGAIIESNCLGKATAATRRSSAQRLSELYALDPQVAVFRVMRRLWLLDADPGRRLLALLCAIARDPLLAATANPVLSLKPGDEFLREPMRHAIREAVGQRFNDAILDKVVRNAASTWTQAGHLEGRTFKKRRSVKGSGPTAAFALYLAHTAGFRGAELFASGWFHVLDAASSTGFDLATEAKRLGLLDLRMAGDVVDVNLDRLDPMAVRR